MKPKTEWFTRRHKRLKATEIICFFPISKGTALGVASYTISDYEIEQARFPSDFIAQGICKVDAQRKSAIGE